MRTDPAQQPLESNHDRRVREEIRRHTDREECADQKSERTTEEPPSGNTPSDETSKQLPHWIDVTVKLLSGTILLSEGITQYYRYLWGIAAMFFVSIFVLFLSLQLDLRCSSLEREVRILRAKQTMLESRRYKETTHTAIVEKLHRHQLKLSDPKEPARKIEE